MREQKRYLSLDRYEYGVLVNVLNDMRNQLINENRPTDAVDEMLLKVIDIPIKK